MILSPIMFLVFAALGVALMAYEIARGALSGDWPMARARMLSVSLTLNLVYVLLSLGALLLI